MTLIKWRPRRDWDPFVDLMDLHSDINRLFRRSLTPSERESRWTPATDIYRENGEVVLKADVPGLEKKDIEISVVDNILEIKGSRKKEEEVNEEEYHYGERSYGEFVRRVELLAEVDASKVKATLNNGVLEVRLTEIKPEEPKKIPINIK